jgi:aconitate hydratase
MEFVGPGVANLSADFRIGVDVMTTETTCLTSIWQTDEKIREFYEIHGRSEDYQELVPGDMAYYDSMIQVDLSAIRPMIAMPFHPSNVYTIEELNANPDDILKETEERAKVSLGEDINLNLRAKLHNGRLLVEQGIIAGCAGGGFENICAATDILRGKYIGSGAFTLCLYPASTPIYMELVKAGFAADLLETGAILKTAFCGPCFGAGDTPANGAFSIRHSTRNFPNREGSKLQNGQISSVALMDARSIAATAANKGLLTPATEFTGSFGKYAYHYDPKIYDNRVYDSQGIAHPEVELQLGPNIKDWPQMAALPENLLLRVVCEIHDPVTTTDELIPSGETSSYRSNPMGLAEYTLSRKDPDYVPRAKEMKLAEDALLAGQDPWNASATFELGKLKPQIEKFLAERRVPVELATVAERTEQAAGTDRLETAAGTEQFEPTVLTTLSDPANIGFGSLIFAVKPGDGSAREQAASCQKVLGGWANIANEYATKRYRSNLINWGILPFLIEEGELPFHNLDYIWIPDIRNAVIQSRTDITAYRVTDSSTEPFTLRLGALTDKERSIITEGCLINYNRI